MLTDVGQRTIFLVGAATPAFRKVSLAHWANPNEAAV
jgi:hypothetical protein